MKTILLVVLIFASGCGWINREIAGWTGDAVETCHQGVSYLQFPSGATVQYTTEGKIQTCN